jgi:hypothetical protein
MKNSTKARHGRRRNPEPGRGHRHAGATQDPLVRAENVAYRRARLAAQAEGLPTLMQGFRGRLGWS